MRLVQAKIFNVNRCYYVIVERIKLTDKSKILEFIKLLRVIYVNIKYLTSKLILNNLEERFYLIFFSDSRKIFSSLWRKQFI